MRLLLRPMEMALGPGPSGDGLTEEVWAWVPARCDADRQKAGGSFSRWQEQMCWRWVVPCLSGSC